MLKSHRERGWQRWWRQDSVPDPVPRWKPSALGCAHLPTPMPESRTQGGGRGARRCQRPASPGGRRGARATPLAAPGACGRSYRGQRGRGPSRLGGCFPAPPAGTVLWCFSSSATEQQATWTWQPGVRLLAVGAQPSAPRVLVGGEPGAPRRCGGQAAGCGGRGRHVFVGAHVHTHRCLVIPVDCGLFVDELRGPGFYRPRPQRLHCLRWGQREAGRRQAPVSPLSVPWGRGLARGGALASGEAVWTRGSWLPPGCEHSSPPGSPAPLCV